MLSSPLVELAVWIVRFMVATVHGCPKDTTDQDAATVVDAVFVYIVQPFLTLYVLAFVLDFLYF